jgi:hypothetical protein
MVTRIEWERAMRNAFRDSDVNLRIILNDGFEVIRGDY